MNIKIDRDDIKKFIYFISDLTQTHSDKPMQGALSSKGDFMGGILDRWINIIPESIIFNKQILPKVQSVKEISVITDYYEYDPKIVGIAPDVIGIRVNGKAIPFVVFNNKWEVVDGCPQIEVKTFKKKQKMLSLRDQNYIGKYLVIVETDFRVDYLVPMIDPYFYSESVYKELHMDDDIFIVANDKKIIKQTRQVDISSKDIGYVKLLRITTAEEFISMSNKCEAKIGIEYFSGIEKYTGKDKFYECEKKLSEYGEIISSGLFSFNNNWYSYLDSKGKTIRNFQKAKTINIYADNPEAITILKIFKSKIWIRADEKCMWESIELEKGCIYKIGISVLERGAGEEYFLLKSSITHLKDFELELINCIDRIVKESL